MPAPLQLSSLSNALAHLESLGPAASIDVPGPWSWAQTLEHCAQSIECSLNGFPKLKPAFVRATIGRLVIRKFLRRGWFNHDLAGPVPGAADLEADDPHAAEQRLRAAIERFEAHEGELAPHFIFGTLSKADFDHFHAMHLADHFAAVG